MNNKKGQSHKGIVTNNKKDSVIMSNQELSVNTSNVVCDEDITIQRCLHDQENPYTMIPKELIMDNSISIGCRGLLIYLLSMKDGYDTGICQGLEYLKLHMQEDEAYSIIDEAIKAGYLTRRGES